MRFRPSLLLPVLLSAFAPGLSAQAPAPTAPAGSEQLSLRPGDLIRVRVWPDSTLGGSFPVEESGEVDLPIIGVVSVRDRSLAALREDLRARYAQSMKAPVVVITPVFRVSVLGAVQRPGLYQVEPNTGLYDVISMAGGFMPNAKENEIRLVRDGNVTVINARSALGQGGSGTTADLQLQSADRVIVPASHGGISMLAVLQSLTLIATIWSIAKR